MKTVKRIFVLLSCFVVLLSSFMISSSAVEFNPFTEEEMLFDGNSYYSAYEPLEFEPFSFYRRSSPNYSDFDINSLPWFEMPNYVQEILTASKIPDAVPDYNTYTGGYKYPFVSVVVNEEAVIVLAGYNLCVGTYFQTSDQFTSGIPYRVFLCSLKIHSNIYNNAVCYAAAYSRDDYSVLSDWSSLDAVAVGDNIVRYYNYNYDISGQDYYFYGYSGMYPDRVLQYTPINHGDTDGYPRYVTVNSPAGFASGTITYLPDVWSGYITSFAPPTIEQQQASTSKGILGALKELPSKIKGFFDDLKNYLLYFQADKPEHVNPFANILDSVQTFFDEQCNNLADFTDYVDSFTGLEFFSSFASIFDLINSSMILRLFFICAWILFVVRKVVGR